MNIRIINAYISESYVIVITAGTSYKYRTRLKADKAQTLLSAVINRGFIDDSKWVEI